MDDRTADLAQVIEGGDYTRTRLAVGGIRGTKAKLTTPDGSHIFYKDSSAGEVYAGLGVQQADSEQLAVGVAKAVGLDVPRVYRNTPGAIYHEWVEGVPFSVAKKSEDKELRRTANRLVKAEQGQKLALFDLLTLNMDRHGHNILVFDGELAAIDNGEAWQWAVGLDFDDLLPGDIGSALLSSKGPVKRFFVDTETNQWGVATAILGRPAWLTDTEVRRLEVELGELRPQFDKLGRGEWLDRSLAILGVLRGKVRWPEKQREMLAEFGLSDDGTIRYSTRELPRRFYYIRGGRRVDIPVSGALVAQRLVLKGAADEQLGEGPERILRVTDLGRAILGGGG
jgi:hypothetical protein